MYNVRKIGWMFKSMLMHKKDSKEIVKCDFVTLYFAFKGSIPIGNMYKMITTKVGFLS